MFISPEQYIRISDTRQGGCRITENTSDLYSMLQLVS